MKLAAPHEITQSQDEIEQDEVELVATETDEQKAKKSQGILFLLVDLCFKNISLLLKIFKS